MTHPPSSPISISSTSSGEGHTAGSPDKSDNRHVPDGTKFGVDELCRLFPDAPVSALQTMYSICDGDFHETVEVMLSGPTFTHIQEAFWQHKLWREYRTLTMDPNDLIGSAVPYYK